MQDLFLCYYLLIIELFSKQITINILLPHPVYNKSGVAKCSKAGTMGWRGNGQWAVCYRIFNLHRKHIAETYVVWWNQPSLISLIQGGWPASCKGTEVGLNLSVVNASVTIKEVGTIICCFPANIPEFSPPTPGMWPNFVHLHLLPTDFLKLRLGHH